MNKQKAIKRIQERLDAMEELEIAKRQNEAWREHTRLVRGNPIRVYKGMKFVRKK